MLDFLGPFTLIFYFAIGIAAGIKLFPTKFLKANRVIQTICLCVILFNSGIALGTNPNLWEDLRTAGIQALCYALLPIAFSIGTIYLLTRFVFNKEEKR